jgi:hypothetical protein
MYIIDENGCLHRDHLEGPALIYENGIEKYYKHGELHRPAELGPAIYRPIKNRFTSKLLKDFECEDIQWDNGYFEYYENGKRHRPALLGPAIIWINGEHGYFENGIRKTIDEFKAIYKIQRWFRQKRFYNKYRDLFEKVLGLPANHNSILGRMYPDGGDIYKEVYKVFHNIILY